MIQKFGICTCHNKHNPINSRGLCPEGARERHEYSAAMKNMVVKKNKTNIKIEIKDGADNTRRSGSAYSKINQTFDREMPDKKTFAIQKTKINPCSEKKKEEDAELARIKKLKIAELGKKCEMCPKHGEVDLFHIIGRGDKKFSTDPTNLLLSCRWCHNVWTANDWGKIIKFQNFQEIMDRLKSMDEGRYWKLKHKIDEYLSKI